jgi:hypothetical protein
MRIAWHQSTRCKLEEVLSAFSEKDRLARCAYSLASQHRFLRFAFEIDFVLLSPEVDLDVAVVAILPILSLFLD